VSETKMSLLQVLHNSWFKHRPT